MHSWIGWLGGVAFIVALNLGANLVARGIYPVLIRNGIGAWMPYRIVPIASFFALLAVALSFY